MQSLTVDTPSDGAGFDGKYRSAFVAIFILLAGGASASIDPPPPPHPLLDFPAEQCVRTTSRFLSSDPECITIADHGAVSFYSFYEFASGIHSSSGSRVELTWDGPSNHLLASVTSRADSALFAELRNDAVTSVTRSLKR